VAPLSGFAKLVIVCVGACGFVLALAVASGAVFRVYRVPQAAMEPAIRAGEMIVVRRTKNVARGHIIAFRYPPNPRVTFVKRAIAIGGDTVEIRDKKVFLNGTALIEPYVVHRDPQIYPAGDFLPQPQRSRDQFGPLQVPAGQIFVLGDNRDHASDSRYWGTVPRENVIGRVISGR